MKAPRESMSVHDELLIRTAQLFNFVHRLDSPGPAFIDDDELAIKNIIRKGEVGETGTRIYYALVHRTQDPGLPFGIFLADPTKLVGRSFPQIIDNFRYDRRQRNSIATKGIFCDTGTNQLVIFDDDREIEVTIQLADNSSAMDLGVGTVGYSGGEASAELARSIDNNGLDLDVLFKALGWNTDEFAPGVWTSAGAADCYYRETITD